MCRDQPPAGTRVDRAVSVALRRPRLPRWRDHSGLDHAVKTRIHRPGWRTRRGRRRADRPRGRRPAPAPAPTTMWWSPPSWTASSVTVDPGQDAVDQRRTGLGRLPSDGGELVVTAGGEHPAHVLLVGAEDVHAERSAGLHAGPRVRRLADAESDQGGLDRQREERPDGQADGIVAVQAGDDRDPRGEVAEHLSVVGLVDRAGLVAGHGLGPYRTVFRLQDDGEPFGSGERPRRRDPARWCGRRRAGSRPWRRRGWGRGGTARAAWRRLRRRRGRRSRPCSDPSRASSRTPRACTARRGSTGRRRRRVRAPRRRCANDRRRASGDRRCRSTTTPSCSTR